jgi:hypothetical protein
MRPGERLWRVKMAWQTLFAGPLRVKVVIERPDGTELMHFYPLKERTVEYGMKVDIGFTVGEVEFSEV